MVKALARQSVRSLHYYSLEVEKSALLNYSQVVSSPRDILMSLSRYHDFWRTPVGNVPEEISSLGIPIQHHRPSGASARKAIFDGSD